MLLLGFRQLLLKSGLLLLRLCELLLELGQLLLESGLLLLRLCKLLLELGHLLAADEQVIGITGNEHGYWHGDAITDSTVS